MPTTTSHPGNRRREIPDGLTRVLIVDDHPVVRKGYSLLIESEPGLTVCGEAETTHDALRLARETKPHLAVVDITLKGGSGIDLIKCLKSRDAELKVLVVSAHQEGLFAERALRAGALGFINKQAAVEHLVTAIGRVLDGDVYLSERINNRLLKRLAGLRGESEPSAIDTLSDRELEAFELVGQGKTTREIARLMHVSTKTIDRYRENIKHKLGLTHATELIQHATQWVLENR